ncbi:SGNH/GDSL hydrolase family protein [Pseudonocardia benzenivorans]|uniref:Lipolytic protein G-D-S-L family n=2 Tax=Pseudonocardia TaxID=1847 RepID=F4CX93_PSEUX|nr:SGNH/GDSL hydrolase family protein [Pseudonocardia dioxanivorans]AEA25534.1 lipolytic protein G-D-S-L family [Pseudonocardia dioxanivorans CB1190]
MPRRHVWRAVVSFAAAAGIAAAGSLLAAAPALAAEPATAGRYVALGDSYTAGPLVPIQTGRPAGCLRSTNNYPALVARALAVATVSDVSCSGATTANLGGPQPTGLGTNAPQLDALGPDVSLVTLGIGGNDIGFVSIITDCATRSPLHPTGAACRDHFTAADGTDELAARIDATAPKIAAALADIEERAPDAHVLVVGYPALLPDTGPGCFPVVPFSPGDVAYLRGVEKELNAMLAAQAAAAGADYVDTYTPGVGHDMCAPQGTRWIEGLVPTSPAAPVHPNAAGMRGMADAVLGALSPQAQSAA